MVRDPPPASGHGGHRLLAEHAEPACESASRVSWSWQAWRVPGISSRSRVAICTLTRATILLRGNDTAARNHGCAERRLRMISRHWRGVARAVEADNYVRHLQQDTFPQLSR